MANEISVRFILAGFNCDPHEITDSLSVKPTKIWRRGDFIDKTIRKYSENGWRVDSSLGSSAGIDAQVDQLLEILEPVADAIAGIAAKSIAEFSCIVYANESVPSIFFSSATVKRIAKLHAEIDVDLYCCIED